MRHILGKKETEPKEVTKVQWVKVNGEINVEPSQVVFEAEEPIAQASITKHTV